MATNVTDYFAPVEIPAPIIYGMLEVIVIFCIISPKIVMLVRLSLFFTRPVRAAISNLSVLYFVQFRLNREITRRFLGLGKLPIPKISTKL